MKCFCIPVGKKIYKFYNNQVFVVLQLEVIMIYLEKDVQENQIKMLQHIRNVFCLPQYFLILIYKSKTNVKDLIFSNYFYRMNISFSDET